MVPAAADITVLEQPIFFEGNGQGRTFHSAAGALLTTAALQYRIATFALQRSFRFTLLGLAFCFFRFSNTTYPFTSRYWNTNPRLFPLNIILVLLIQTNFSLICLLPGRPVSPHRMG